MQVRLSSAPLFLAAVVWIHPALSYSQERPEQIAECPSNLNNHHGVQPLQCWCEATTQGDVAGTDVYTSNSDICAAAIHAGVLPPGTPGAIVLEPRPSEVEYRGSTRNGITSVDSIFFPSSFAFVAKGPKEAEAWGDPLVQRIASLPAEIESLATAEKILLDAAGRNWDLDETLNAAFRRLEDRTGSAIIERWNAIDSVDELFEARSMERTGYEGLDTRLSEAKSKILPERAASLWPHALDEAEQKISSLDGGLEQRAVHRKIEYDLYNLRGMSFPEGADLERLATVRQALWDAWNRMFRTSEPIIVDWIEQLPLSRKALLAAENFGRQISSSDEPLDDAKLALAEYKERSRPWGVSRAGVVAPVLEEDWRALRDLEVADVAYVALLLGLLQERCPAFPLKEGSPDMLEVVAWANRRLQEAPAASVFEGTSDENFSALLSLWSRGKAGYQEGGSREELARLEAESGLQHARDALADADALLTRGCEGPVARDFIDGFLTYVKGERGHSETPPQEYNAFKYIEQAAAKQ